MKRPRVGGTSALAMLVLRPVNTHNNTNVSKVEDKGCGVPSGHDGHCQKGITGGVQISGLVRKTIVKTGHTRTHCLGVDRCGTGLKDIPARISLPPPFRVAVSPDSFPAPTLDFLSHKGRSEEYRGIA